MGSAIEQHAPKFRFRAGGHAEVMLSVFDFFLQIFVVVRVRVAFAACFADGLGNLPILGALFRSTSFKRDESELLVVVKVHLVQPQAPGDAPVMPGQGELNDPNDLQLFFLGMDGVKSDLPPARNEAIQVKDHRGGPAGSIGFSRKNGG